MRHEGITPVFDPQETHSLEKPSEFGAEYEMISRLLDRLDNIVYLDNETQQEEEVDELCSTVLSIMDADPYLEHVISNQNKFKLWEKLSKTIYKYLQKTNLNENTERLSVILGRVLKIADPETNKSPADNVLINLLKQYPWSNLKHTTKETRISERNKTVLLEFCNQFCLDAETVFNTWFASHQNPSSTTANRGGHPILTAYHNCIETRRLESHYPGGPKKLIEEFGVYCFSRYPKGVLDNQLDQADDAKTPYGVVIASIGDHNGILYGDASYNSLNSLLQQCRKAGYNLRVIESDSKVGLLKKLLFLDKKYHTPTGQKIEFGVISGHGNRDVLEMGADPSSPITLEDVLSDDFKRASERFFEPGANIVINSCLVGKENGLAQQASASMQNINITACQNSISGAYYSLTPSVDGKSPPELTVKYKTGLIPKKSKVSYKGGERF